MVAGWPGCKAPCRPAIAGDEFATSLMQWSGLRLYQASFQDRVKNRPVIFSQAKIFVQ